WVGGCPEDQRPLQWVIHTGVVSRSTWKTSQAVLKGLHRQLIMQYCRTWMVWNTNLPSLLRRTSQYSMEPFERVEILALKWEGLIGRLKHMWEGFVRGGWVMAQQLDEMELIEHNLLFGDEDIGNNLILGEVEVVAGED
ncbi:hypothetical protein DFH28DRAFT_900891, partial [Melampsora americana]